MNNTPKMSIIALIASFMILGNALVWYFLYSPHSKKEVVIIETAEVQKATVRDILYNDISVYRHLSDEMKHNIVDEIVLQAENQGIDPRLLYSFIKVESTFRINARHTPTFVKKLNKEVQAVGLTAIIWEFHEDIIKARTSIREKSELKNWRKNIEAGAAVLAYLSEFKMHPRAKDVKESVAARYYGVYHLEYVGRINDAFYSLV